MSAPYLLEERGRPGGHDEVARMCSLHFSEEDYDNIRQFEAGFASCLVLKAGAVPRLFGEPDVPVEKVAANFQ